MEQTELDKITQLLKTGDCNNQILAIQLAIGQGLSIDEIVELCLCLEKVVYTNGGTELILCDYGIEDNISFNSASGINNQHYISRWSLTLRSEYLKEFNEYVDDFQPTKLKLLKEIIESVI